MPQRRGDNTRTTLGRLAPKISEGQKMSTFRRDFWQLSTLIANVSGIDRHIEHLRKTWSATTPSTFGEKTLVNFGPQTKKFCLLILTNQRRYFSGDYILAIRGCCVLKFLNALEIDQGYLAHIQAGTGVPPKKFNRENLKLALKLNVWSLITSGLGEYPHETSPDDVTRGRGDKARTTFGRPAPKIWEGRKTSKFLRDFWQLSTSIANISITDRHIEHLKKKLDQPLPLPRWEKKIRWTLVHKQKSSSDSYRPTQVHIFLETTFRPLGVAAPWHL